MHACTTILYVYNRMHTVESSSAAYVDRLTDRSLPYVRASFYIWKREGVSVEDNCGSDVA